MPLSRRSTSEEAARQGYGDDGAHGGGLLRLRYSSADSIEGQGGTLDLGGRLWWRRGHGGDSEHEATLGRVPFAYT